MSTPKEIIIDGVKYTPEQPVDLGRYGVKIDEEINEIDWSKMPMDTIVEVRDSVGYEWQRRYFKGLCGPEPYPYTGSSTAQEMMKPDENYGINYKQIRLVDNPWRPWFGSEEEGREMPCCGNVTVDIKLADGIIVSGRTADGWEWDWEPEEDRPFEGDIIAYRMRKEPERD